MPVTTASLDPAALLERTSRYVAHVVHHWARRYRLDPDDIIQTAALLILTRFDRFDPDVTTPERWAGRLATRAVNIVHRQRDGNTLGRAVPLPLGLDGTEVAVADRRTPDPADQAEAADLADAIRRAVAGLPAKERAAVLARVRDEADRDRRVERRAIRRLREAME